MTIKIYQPKGSMCIYCKHRGDFCWSLPFHSMPMIEKDNDRVIVRCTHFERNKNEESM